MRKSKFRTALLFVFRLITSPLIFTLTLFRVLASTIMYVMYGGEMITYHKGEKAMIYDIYKELKDKRDEIK